MQPVPMDSSAFVKTHVRTHFCPSLFEVAFMKKSIVFFLLLSIQTIIIYGFYISQGILHFKNTREASWNHGSTVEFRSSTQTLEENVVICANGLCAQNDMKFGATKKLHFEDSADKVPEAPSNHSAVDNTETHAILRMFHIDDFTGIEFVKQKSETDLAENDLHDLLGFRPFDQKKVVLPDCERLPSGLQGFLDISFANDPYSMQQIAEENPLVANGGHFRPPFCKALWKVAIIIPFRDRDEHLRYFLQYMHPILQRQQLEYRIYIINQFGMGKFNRAKLMNIGYAESIKDHNFQCFVFHDVDLILENDYAMYSCPRNPRHLSAGVDKFNYALPYNTIFGGVTELSRHHFEKVNGYSNKFWGWGGEDDDMFNRLRLNYIRISRYSPKISKYRMISHGREQGNEANPHRYLLMKQTGYRMRRDGLNSLRYKVEASMAKVAVTHLFKIPCDAGTVFTCNKVLVREDHTVYTNITVNLLQQSLEKDNPRLY